MALCPAQVKPTRHGKTKALVKTCTVPAAQDDPQYLMKSDKTGHLARHQGAALKKIVKSNRPSRSGRAHKRRIQYWENIMKPAGGSWNEPKSTAKRSRTGSVSSAPAKGWTDKTSSLPKAESFPLVMTIGHSTRTLAEFIHLLLAHDVSRVVDVRTVPRSRHNPQFNKTSLPRALRKAGLDYVHMPGLGGLRHARRDSINMGWRNTSFRGYADFMQTPEFELSLDELIRLAKQEQIALMCAEAVPWRCHRSLIADALLVRGIRTEDIMSPIRRTPHTLTPFAKVRGTTITYPAELSPDSPKKPAAKRSQSGPSKKPDSH